MAGVERGVEENEEERKRGGEAMGRRKDKGRGQEKKI